MKGRPFSTFNISRFISHKCYETTFYLISGFAYDIAKVNYNLLIEIGYIFYSLFLIVL